MNNQNCYLQLKRDGKLNEIDAPKGNIQLNTAHAV